MINQYTIRKATEADAEQILIHIQKVLEAYPDFLASSPEEFNTTLEEEKEWIASHEKHGLLLVAEVEQKIIGLLNFRLSTRKKFCHQGMFGMSIQEPYTDQGIGSSLLQHLLEWAKKDERVEKVSLEVFSNNKRALHLYEKFGFIEEGRRKKNAKLRPGYYVDDIYMSQFV
ncbi:GNAT family N-acetyltransferase [Fictibacillus sp. WQ 8-8]|uniref:GNAT family N-acetyltransferase n=1 Tax=Fictibacillus sp. WQ 8-8 TaxID=2938788 RepID=UPI00210B55C8|nr:GNAT family N-acetyltransferase [Fictibacillus sp. WQ 8-8]MCQ6268701.1 GNAT family N-acetyltransferase [Fictibacillus sp. WQ 8-8]